MAYLNIGFINNSHGLHGEVKVLCNYFGKNFPWKTKLTVYYQDNDNFYPLIITSIRHQYRFLLFMFQGYNNIESTMSLKRKPLFLHDTTIADHNLPWIYEDLTGYQVLAESNSKSLGIITSFYDNNHQGLWEVKMTNNKSFFIPNNEHFIIKINKTERTVYCHIIEGLITND